MKPSDITNTITMIENVLVGHATDSDALTGCTVIICPKGAVGGVDQRGGAPGTRETDLLKPMHFVQKAHAILLSGGSAFGLNAAAGVMRYLEEKDIGFDSGFGKVPIVPAAILFDLGIGDPEVRPTEEMGYQACLNANNDVVLQGNFGAGTGATVGKLFGMSGAMKSGIGSHCVSLSGGIKIGAVVAVNAFGDVIDYKTNKILAGTRTTKKGPIKIGSNNYFADTLQTMGSVVGEKILRFASHQNTVIGVVATNAKLSKEEINKVAQMAQDGIAMSIRPAHTMFDGDTLFALSTGNKSADVNVIGAYAAQAVAVSIYNAVLSAESTEGIPSYRSYIQQQ